MDCKIIDDTECVDIPKKKQTREIELITDASLAIVILIILFCFACPKYAVAIDLAEKDLAITGILDDTIFVGVEYDSLFRITNLNHTTNVDDSINASVAYNMTKINQENNNYELVKDDFFFLHNINYRTSAGTGNHIFTEEGNYTICARIINSTAYDANNYNDFFCYTIFALDTTQFACNITINISSDKQLYNDSEQIKFYNKLNNNTFPFVIEYWIEDLFGIIIKEKQNTSNQNQKTYSPDIDEKDRVFILKNQLVNVGCNNINEITESIREIIITSNFERSGPANESNIVINNIKLNDDKSVKYGEIFFVEIEAYRGDTRKSVINIWVEEENDDGTGGTDLSEKTKIEVNEEYSKTVVTLPVVMKPNCNMRYKDGVKKLIVQGIDINVTEDVRIKGINERNCPDMEADDNDENKSPGGVNTSQKGNATAGKKINKTNKKIENEIKSFYTRAKKPIELINLYSTIADPIGKFLVFDSSVEHQEFSLNKNNNSIKLTASVLPGKNVYILRIFDKSDKETVLDQKVLIVYSDSGTSEEYQTEFGMVKTNNEPPNAHMTNLTIATLNNKFEQCKEDAFGRCTKEPTDNILYESASRMSSTITAYFIILFLATIVLTNMFKTRD